MKRQLLCSLLFLVAVGNNSLAYTATLHNMAGQCLLAQPAVGNTPSGW